MTTKIYNLRFWAFGGWFTFIAVAIGGAALIGGGVSLYENAQNQKAISQEQNLVSGLQYQPIDIPKLQAAATQASIADATNSLALQRSLQPAVAASNAALQASVAKQLALGGNLGPDLSNQIASAARTSGGVSGAQGNVAPETAALIGQSSLGLLQQRQQAAATQEAANPAPAVGLSPSDLASATIANTNATNQFNLAKAGANAGLIGASAQASGAEAGGISGSLTQAAGLLALLNKGTPTTTLNGTTPIAGVPSSVLNGGGFGSVSPVITTPTVTPGGGSIIGGY